jgi:SAM-dependent methyltransferase
VKTSLTADDWHRRFLQQTAWTRSVRDYLFQKVFIEKASKIIEIGCGTGAVLADLPQRTHAVIFGLDIYRNFLNTARSGNPVFQLTQGDALHLPYSNASFDISYCHFLLLWLSDPVQALREIYRVTCPGGHILILAEPDYGGRIDFPPALEKLGGMQTLSLRNHGADPLAGRKILSWLIEAGFTEIETGILGGQWNPLNKTESLDSEWLMLHRDLDGLIKTEELETLHLLDRESSENGVRVLFVPTFYALAHIPE